MKNVTNILFVTTWSAISAVILLNSEWYFFLAWIIFGSPTLYFGILQINEEQTLNNFIKKNHIKNVPLTHETAVSISQLLRNIFNTNEDQFEHLLLHNRPFLRESSSYLLEKKEGLCGEGTRVLVCLLSKLGFNATRVTLYTKHLLPSHTLVSIKLGGNEYLVDTLNTREPVNRFINNNRISTDDFALLSSKDNLNAASEIEQIDSTNNVNKDDEIKAIFFTRFLYYSYEAIPLDKLMRCLSFQTKSLNLKRPGKITSVLAEKPYFILMLIFLSLYSITLSFLLMFTL